MASRFVLAFALVLLAAHRSGTTATSDTIGKIPGAQKSAARSANRNEVAMLKKTPKMPTQAEAIVATIAATELYKQSLARSIAGANPDKVHNDQPQALLRSVVVIRFSVDKNGKLMSSAVQRSNRNASAEAIALASLRSAAPFPKPPASLLKKGRMEILETWLFNDDGRFQIRSIAQAQKSE